jgi:translation initiation factor IF-2
MLDPKGRAVRKAGPASAVSILGLADVPQAGDSFRALDDERLAREISVVRQDRRRAEDFENNKKVSLEEFFRRSKEGASQELRLIVKADVQGAVEALRGSLEKLQIPEVKVNIIHGAVGGINVSDVMLASASEAIIVGFNVRPDPGARKLAERETVDIRTYRIIYEALDDIKLAVRGLLKPEMRELVVGRAEVRAIFKVRKAGTIAGCYVTEGKITRSSAVRVIRDGVVVHDGKIDSLKRFKDDAREVLAAFECGIGLEKFPDIRAHDILEAYAIQEVAREAAKSDTQG